MIPFATARGLSALLLLPLGLGSVAVSCAPHESAEAETPDRDVHGSEEDEHAPGLLRLTPKQLEAAAAQIQVAEAGEVWSSFVLPAAIEANADAVLHVNPRVPGLVRAIHKQLGDRVETGDLLCVIDSVQLGDAVADYLRDQAMSAAAEETLARERALFEGRLVATEAVLDGAIEVSRRIHEREQELQEQALSTVRPLLESEKSLQTAQLLKVQDLTELRAERDARLLSLEVSVREKRIALQAARAHLRALGIGEATIDELGGESPLVAGTYEIRSQGRGVLLARHISVGESVDSTTQLFVVEDLSTVWAIASAFEQQLARVRTDQSAIVRLDAFPGKAFPGVVARIGYQIDPRSRAVGIRVELANPDLEAWPEPFPIRPGMFGNVELLTDRRLARVVLPEAALVHDDDEDYVFVELEPGTLERRSVEAQPCANDLVEIVAGLEPGERVAVSGTFLLKSVERSEELGGGHSH